MPLRLGHFDEDLKVRGRKLHVAAKIDQWQIEKVTDQLEMGYCSQFGLGEVEQPNWHGTSVTLMTYLAPSFILYLGLCRSFFIRSVILQ